MTHASVKELSSAWWSEVYNRIIGAVVFLEEDSIECLHWEGGLYNLMSAGAVMVKALTTFESCPNGYKKAVFITQATMAGLSAIREIIYHSDLTHCILISCVSLDVVFLELNAGKDVSDIIAAGRGPEQAARMLEDMLYEWIGKTQCVVDIVHIPIFTISLTNVIFVTPPFKNYFSGMDSQAYHSFLPVSDLYQLSDAERSKVRRMASGLNSIMDSMNLKEEIYFMGSYSSLVASVLENSPVCLNRKKNCQNSATLILIDRTLDVCGITSHSSESVLDKITAVLPKFTGHGNEVAVDISSLCQANVINHPVDDHISSGYLYHANDESCVQTYDHMINKTQKEVMLDLYNKLSKIDVEKSPSPKNLLRVTPQSIEKIVYGTKGNYKIIEQNLGVLQQALAMVQTLKSPRRQLLELMQNLEKQVLQSLTTSRDSTSVLYQITHLIRTRRDKNIPTENLLALIVHIYSLTGTDVTFSREHEENLMEALSVAIYEDYDTLFMVSPDQVVTPEDGISVAKEIMDKLRDISMIKKSMHKYKSVLKPSEDGQGEEYKGLLQQFVEDLVNSERPELPDLSHRSEGIKDLLLTGFNMLTNKKSRVSKHPLDNPLVIIFVIGGINAEECKRLHRTVITSGVDNTVLFGATRLATPMDGMRDALGIGGRLCTHHIHT